MLEICGLLRNYIPLFTRTAGRNAGRFSFLVRYNRGDWVPTFDDFLVSM